jgi:hypothetical protein
MATIQTINIGNIVNDGLGDDLRTAFQKVNANFATLNNDLTITASNLGTVGEPVFKQKSGVNLEFKKLVAGNKITISSSPDSLLIASTVGTSFTRITTQSGFIDANISEFITIQGNNDIRVNSTDDVITISTVLDLNQILKVVDFGPMDGLYTSTMQMNTAGLNLDFGTYTNPGTINLNVGLLPVVPNQSVPEVIAPPTFNLPNTVTVLAVNGEIRLSAGSIGTGSQIITVLFTISGGPSGSISALSSSLGDGLSAGVTVGGSGSGIISLTGTAENLSNYLSTPNRILFNGIASATPYILLGVAQQINSGGFVESQSSAQSIVTSVNTL